MNIVIECEKVSKSYENISALRDINLRLAQGSFLAVFGPNGAGKTTLLKILSNLVRPTSGTVKINGVPISDETNEIRRSIGVVSHNTFLYNNLTPYENLEFYGKMYNVPDLKKRIGEVIDEVGLTARMNDPVRTFSRGMMQRLSIARVLMPDPSIIYLDEPYTGLDQHAAIKLRDILRNLKKGDRTIIMITHNIERGLEVCTHVAIQAMGRIVYMEEIEKVDRDNFETKYFDMVGKGHY
ncbi:MAG: ABC transporter ATP-binding protein [Nitrospinae bacterium]|nr:ABC transporter ATP-binding protein [Nitrospinota bacterium]